MTSCNTKEGSNKYNIGPTFDKYFAYVQMAMYSTLKSDQTTLKKIFLLTINIAKSQGFAIVYNIILIYLDFLTYRLVSGV
jgi:hypothetical protein